MARFRSLAALEALLLMLVIAWLMPYGLPWGTAVAVLGGFFFVPIAALIVDALVVAYYFRQVQPTISLISTLSMGQLFFAGATWRFVRDMAEEVREFSAPLRELEATFPELRTDAAFRVARAKHDYVTMIAIVERKEHARSASERREERQKRRAAFQRAECGQLAAQCRELGADPQAVAEALRLGSGALRTLLLDYRSHQELMRRASVLGCLALVRGTLALEGRDQAEAMYAAVETLFNRAARCGVEAQCRTVFAEGGYQKALECVAEAERRQVRAAEEDALRGRIEACPGPVRAELLGQLGSLQSLPYGSRPYRKLLYQIEQRMSQRVR